MPTNYKLTEMMKIFELRWNSQEEKEWIAANTNIEALKVYCSITGMDLKDLDDEDEILEVPEPEWKNLRVRYEDDSEDEQLEEDEISITFKQWMERHHEPDLIASTICD
jgi:hypothetical protein